MSKRIEARVLSQDLKITKTKEDSLPKVEGSTTIEFYCDQCSYSNRYKQDFSLYNGESIIYPCKSCEEEYLLDIEIKNPVHLSIGDKSDVQRYREMIPILQKLRGVQPMDETNTKR